MTALDPSRDSRTSLLRMLDANLNRVAEALRVVEDVCRLHWELPGIAAAFKALRHGAFAAVERAGVAAGELSRARDIEGDVGTENASPATGAMTPADLALRNASRAQEALRVVEESVRALGSVETAVIESLRYRLYGEAKALRNLADPGTRAVAMAAARLYLIAVPGLGPWPLERAVEEAVAGGVDVVQLRAKDLDGAALLHLARRLREITARAGVLFIVNDRPDVARLVHADGVHVGQADLPVAAAREIVGPDLLVGLSTHSAAQADAARRLGADSIGVGPAFGTATRPGHAPVLGAQLAGEIAAGSDLPAFVIGGVGPGNLPALVRAGVRRIAVAAALLGASDVRSAASELRALLDSHP